MTKLIAILGTVVLAAATSVQAQPQSSPAGQNTQATAPAPATPAQAAPAQPTGRPPVQAKSAAEYQAYRVAVGNVNSPEAMEKAADDFAAKFPDSDLRVLLLRAAMNSYQSAGNSLKMMDMGMKVLAIDKDDPEALIGVAEVLEEHTSPTDLDREQRYKQAIAYAQHATETIDTDLAVPAGVPAEKVEAYKKYLHSTALVIMGTVQYKREQYADAEANLRKAIETDSANPDPVVILRLTLALDQQKKYPEALQQANRAVQLTQETTEAGKTARSERDRLLAMTGGATTGSATPLSPPPASAIPAEPRNPTSPSH